MTRPMKQTAITQTRYDQLTTAILVTKQFTKLQVCLFKTTFQGEVVITCLKG